MKKMYNIQVSPGIQTSLTQVVLLFIIHFCLFKIIARLLAERKQDL